MGFSRRGFLLASTSALGLSVVAFAACAVEPKNAVRSDLYDCEGCEATMEADSKSLRSVAEVSGPDERGERLLLKGRVLSAIAHEPVEGVIIYLHQTNADGLYAGDSAGSRWSQRHGRLKAWARSDANGNYEFRTIKPAPYPSNTMPAHIHLYILEPGKPPYWIDDVVFDGEFGVTDEYRAKMDNKGGNGIVVLAQTNEGELLAVRDILLEPHPD